MQPKRKLIFARLRILDFEDLGAYVRKTKFSASISSLKDDGWSLTDEKSGALLEKIKSKGIPLGEYVNGKIFRGVLTGLNEAFVIDEVTRKKLIKEDPKSKEVIKPFLMGRDITRYFTATANRYFIFTRRGINISKFPAIKKHLERFRELLEPRPKNWKANREWKGRKPGNYQWYEIQDTVDYYLEFEKPKIIIPAIVQKATYCFDTEGFYSNDKTTIISSDDLYLLGLLNSKAVDYFMHSIASTKQGGYYEYKPMYISQLPIRKIDTSNPKDKSNHCEIVSLVTSLLTLHQQLPQAHTDFDKERLTRHIESADHRIDELVYELYGLTAEEIKIVEGSVKGKK